MQFFPRNPGVPPQIWGTQERKKINKMKKEETFLKRETKNKGKNEKQDKAKCLMTLAENGDDTPKTTSQVPLMLAQRNEHEGRRIKPEGARDV